MAYDGSLVFDTKIDKKGFEKGISGLKSISKKAMTGVAVAATAAGAAIASFGAYSVKAGVAFESAFAGVKKTIDSTDEGYKKLRKSILEMTQVLPASAEEIAGVAEAAGQLGIKEDKVIDFTRTMIDLGESTNLTSNQAATSLARLANITGMAADDYDKLGSTIVSLGNNFATTEAEIVEMGLRLAGTGSQIGLAQDEILSLAAAMSSVGINAEAGGSSMSRVMQKINTAVLSGGANLDGFAQISGMSAETFTEYWKSKPEQAIVSFVAGLGRLKESGQDVSSVLKDLKVSSIQEVDTLLRLSGASETLNDALLNGATAWEENTALANEAAQRYETTESKLKMLKNTANNLSISLGDKLKEGMVDGIDLALESIKSLTEALKTGGISGLVAEFGNVLSNLTVKAAEFGPQLIQMGFNLINTFLQSITENSEQIGSAGAELIGTFVQGIVTSIPLLLEATSGIVVGFANKITENPESLVQAGVDILTNLTNSILENLAIIGEAAIEISTSLIKGISENAGDIATTAGDMISSFIEGVTDALPEVLSVGVDVIVSVVDGILDNLPEIVTAAGEIIATLAMAIIDNLPEIVATGIELVLKLAKTIITHLPEIMAAGVQLVIAIASGVRDRLPEIKQAAVEIIGKFKEKLNPQTLVQIGKDLLAGLWNGISSATGWLMGKVSSWAEDMIGTIKGKFGIHSPSKVMKDEVGRNLVKGIAIGINAEKAMLGKTINNMTKEALSTAIKDAKDYKEIGTIYSNMVKKGFEEAYSDSTNRFNKTLDGEIQRHIAQLEGQKLEKKSGKGTKDYNAEVTAKNKVIAEQIKAYQQAGKQVGGAYEDSLKESFNNAQTLITAEMQQITAEAQKQYDEILRKKDEMAAKLADFGEMFSIDPESGKVVISSIQEQIDAVKEYDEVLTQLKNKGASDNFMEEFSSMTIEEGLQFGKALLEQTDTQFKHYQDKWTQKQKLAKEVAARFYKDQLQTLQSDMVNRLQETLSKVPDITKTVGTDAMQGMIDGMDGMKSEAVGKAREIADAIIEEMERAMDINSPSRVMRDRVGKNIVRGIMVGIDDEKSGLLRQVNGLIDLSSGKMGAISRGNTGVTRSVVTNNTDRGVNQEINVYQPVKSPLEMMREAKRTAKELAYG